MSELICMAFDDRDAADKALNDLRGAQTEHLVELEDACVVVRDAQGKVQLKQAFNVVGTAAASGGLGGALWGGLIGLLFLNPLAGMLVGAGVGAGAGALSSALIDYGISDDFIRKLGSTIRPNTSALFLLVRKINADKVLPLLQRYRGTVLRSSLSDKEEERLRQALAGAMGAAAPAPGHGGYQSQDLRAAS